MALSLEEQYPKNVVHQLLDHRQHYNLNHFLHNRLDLSCDHVFILSAEVFDVMNFKLVRRLVMDCTVYAKSTVCNKNYSVGSFFDAVDCLIEFSHVNGLLFHILNQYQNCCIL